MYRRVRYGTTVAPYFLLHKVQPQVLSVYTLLIPSAPDFMDLTGTLPDTFSSFNCLVTCTCTAFPRKAIRKG
jgi:hypothetical protein